MTGNDEKQTKNKPKEMLDITFDNLSYINTNPITVKFKNVTKKIIFSNEIKPIEIKKSSDIFAKNTSSFAPEISVKGDTITIKNMCLYVHSPLNLLTKFIGSILQASILYLDIKLPKLLDVPNFIPFQSYGNYLCIGNNPITYISHKNLIDDYSDYSSEYIDWYVSINNFIAMIAPKKLKTISFSHNISNIEIVCYNTKHVYTDLIELFNYHSSLFKFKRIVIHDTKLDNYYNLPKVQYIKNSKDYSVSTKHVQGKQNTLTLNYLINISEEVSLDTIDIFHDGTFKLNFAVNTNMIESELMSIIDDYIKNNIESLFEMLMIKYTSYNLPKNVDTLEDAEAEDFENLQCGASKAEGVDSSDSAEDVKDFEAKDFESSDSAEDLKAEDSENLNSSEDSKAEGVNTSKTENLKSSEDSKSSKPESSKTLQGGASKAESSEISDTPLTIKDYIIKTSKFQAVYLIPNINPNNIKKINTVLALQGTESRFASNTSLSLLAHPFINEHILYNMNTNYRAHHVLNDNMTKINIIPEIHFTFSGSNLTIFCNKFYSIPELKFELSYLLQLIDYANISNSKISDNPVDVILDRLRNIPVKQNLKQLVSTDPELFGPRKVSKSSRAYSALCQIKQQRPSIITDREYDILKTAMPDSVIKLQNQTFNDQSLNLACPYDEFPILNFHHYDTQKCIVRCTTKQTNIGQYNNCAKDLGADIITESKLSHQSQSIIKYNEALPKNRFCYLPQELQEIFPDYICTNSENIIEKNEDYRHFIKRIFNAIPLIIRRNRNTESYDILSDYDENQHNYRYVLVIEPESNPRLKYIIIHTSTYKPLFIDDYKNVLDFFKNVHKNNKINENIMTYINKILKLHIDTHISMYKFINEVTSKGFKLIIKDNEILGFVKPVQSSKDIIYLCPKISYPYKDNNTYYSNDYIIKNIRSGIFVYPDISEFKSSFEEGDKYCLDPTTNMITGIFWKYNDIDALMLTKPTELNGIINFKIYDTSKYSEILFNESPIDYIKTKNKLGINNILMRICKMMMKRFIYLDLYTKSKEDYHDDFIKYVSNFGLIHDSDTELIKRTSLLYDIYKTKINKSEFEEFIKNNNILFDEDSIDTMVYDILLDNMQLNCDDNEIISRKQFIG